jgi:HNH endonuclease
MSRTKIRIVGALRNSDSEGLQYSFGTWDEALSETDDWPGLGQRPSAPKSWRDDKEKNALEDEWRRACAAYDQALHSDPEYRRAAAEFIEKQQREPLLFRKATDPVFWEDTHNLLFVWAYRDKVVATVIDKDDPDLYEVKPSGETRIKDAIRLLIKHHVLRREKYYASLRREVEAFENMEKLERVPREPIPEAVRLFVWQRDQGQCVKCGSRERLEFDHIIPIASGGSSTERNVQLLCESCNRAKGATI